MGVNIRYPTEETRSVESHVLRGRASVGDVCVLVVLPLHWFEDYSDIHLVNVVVVIHSVEWSRR